MKDWRPEGTQRSCVEHYGNMAQLAGLKRYILADGKAAGVVAVDVNTGGGLEFTVLPGRGMDIVGCRYRGVPVSYLSKAGITAPGYHDPRENEWLKNFFAGLLTTCGMSNAGPSCKDTHPFAGEILYGLHGDASNIGADQVGTWEDWTEDGYEMKVTGRISEGRLHGEHLTLRRTISARLGEKCFRLRDEYRNEGDQPEPLMFFYHINIGHPILDEGSVFAAADRRVWAETEAAKAGMERYAVCDGPKKNVTEQQFFHEFHTDTEGKTWMALINKKLELGVYLSYHPEQLPYMAQWKVERTGEYVFAFEPGNCHPIGRVEQRKQGGQEILNPMENHIVDLEMGILDGPEEITEFQEKIEKLIGGEERG